MAKPPSMDSEIEKARAAGIALQAHALQLFDRFAVFAKPDRAVDGEEEADRKSVEHLNAEYIAAEVALADLVHQLSQRVDAVYAAFDALDQPTRYERFRSFFSRRNPPSDHRAQQPRKMSLAGKLDEILLLCDQVCGVAAERKAFALDLQQKCEPVSLAFMDRRNRLSAAVETARHELKEQNALLATVQWKAGNTTDETRSAALLAERDALSLAVENAETTYRTVRAAHDGLDRYLQLFESFAEPGNDQLFGNSLLLNRLSCDMERAIQLKMAVSGSLDALRVKVASQETSGRPLLAELLELHATHSISLDEITRRQHHLDQNFLARYALEKGRVTARSLHA